MSIKSRKKCKKNIYLKQLEELLNIKIYKFNENPATGMDSFSTPWMVAGHYTLKKEICLDLHIKFNDYDEFIYSFASLNCFKKIHKLMCLAFLNVSSNYFYLRSKSKFKCDLDDISIELYNINELWIRGIFTHHE